jgi:hypothetical protein
MTHQVNYNGQIHEFPDEATPEMISQALGLKSQEKTNQPSNLLEFVKNKLSNDKPLINPLDLIKGGLIGLGKAGQNIGELAAPLRKYVPESMKFVPDVNIEKEYGSQNPSLSESAGKVIGQTSPLLATGPLGVAGDIAAGSAYGASQSPENPMQGAIFGGGVNAAGRLALPAFNKLREIVQKSNPDLLMKNIQKANDFLKSKATDIYDFVKSEATPRGIKNLSLDKNLFDEIKELPISSTKEFKELIKRAETGDYEALQDT